MEEQGDNTSMVQRSFIDREILSAALFARQAISSRGRVRPSETVVSRVPRGRRIQTFTCVRLTLDRCPMIWVSGSIESVDGGRMEVRMVKERTDGVETSFLFKILNLRTKIDSVGKC